MIKKLREEILLKDASIKKVQFDQYWFYDLKDVSDYLNEELSEVEYIHLPFIVDEVKLNTKCATLEDIERARAAKRKAI